MMCGDKWLETGNPFFDDRPPSKNDLLKEITDLKADLDRLHRERDNFQMQCAAMAEENQRLVEENNTLRQALNEVHD